MDYNSNAYNSINETNKNLNKLLSETQNNLSRAMTEKVDERIKFESEKHVLLFANTLAIPNKIDVSR